MNAVNKDVEKLVKKELAAADEKFSQFHSPHEGYAVILEEVEELEIEMEMMEHYKGALWESVKLNYSAESAVKKLRERAIDAACEAIQVAAMCEKFMRLGYEGE